MGIIFLLFFPGCTFLLSVRHFVRVDVCVLECWKVVVVFLLEATHPPLGKRKQQWVKKHSERL